MLRRTVLGAMGASLGAAVSRPAWGRALESAALGRDDTIRFDVRGAGLYPRRDGPVARWGGNGPNGRLSATTCYLERDGEPLAIVAGELHIQRVPAEEWEAAIVQMKAAGLNTVSSYVFWNQIERSRGSFDFSGRNDLRTFFGLCQRHGMMAILRPGPFCNAEFLLGGLPVWLYGLPTVERSNDLLYLDLVRRYFRALAVHLDGTLWHQGGPIAIVQLENELAVAPIGWSRPFPYGASAIGHTGPTGAEFTRHYRLLHEMAVSEGLLAPFYSATAWGTTEALPIDLLMPTFGGYMDLVPSGAANSELTLFQTEGGKYDDKVPIGFIELGYGTPIRDAFRPRPPADHGYATTLTRFGASRSLMIGYYMCRGGSNPVDGEAGWTTKDAVFPLVSYDFWAPIGEFGEWRESLFRARPVNLFVRSFARELAAAEPRSCMAAVTDPDDDRPRAEARFVDGRGFVFISNFGNVRPLSARSAFSLEIATDRGPVRIPDRGTLSLPSGLMAIWPVNLQLGGGINLRSATAQPVCRFRLGDVHWHVFCQTGTVPVGFVVDRDHLRRVKVTCPHLRHDDDARVAVGELKPGRNSVIELSSDGGTEVRLLILSEHDAQRLALLGSEVEPLLVISEAMVTQQGQALWVAARDRSHMTVSVVPNGRALQAHGATVKADGIFRRVNLNCPFLSPSADIRRLGANKAVIRMAASAFAQVSEIFLDVVYHGDMCRIFDAATGVLLADNMNDGGPWAVGLKRFSRALAGAGLLLRIEPRLIDERQARAGGVMTLTAEQKSIGDTPSFTELSVQPRYSAVLHLA